MDFIFVGVVVGGFFSLLCGKTKHYCFLFTAALEVNIMVLNEIIDSLDFFFFLDAVLMAEIP